MKAIDEYRAALKSLIKKGSKINKDTVALEAGRKRGSIKKSRSGFSQLIREIELAAENQNTALSKALSKSEKTQLEAKNLETLYHDALRRELMMLHKISQLERELRKVAKKNK